MVDLFETLVRYLSVKPLPMDELDFSVAQDYIKAEKQGSIVFTDDHQYFEDTIDAMANRIGKQISGQGTLYIYIKGQNSSDKLKRRLIGLAVSVGRVFIFGELENWPTASDNVTFSQNYDIFADNHQRFFVYQSAALNIALVARHHLHDGKEKIEGAITNAPDAVSVIAQTIGTNLYQAK